MPTYKIKKKYKANPITGCPGYDVDASEDGCSIVPCDCNICTNKKRVQLVQLVDDMDKHSSQQYENSDDLNKLIISWIDKIQKINNNEEVYK